MKLSEGDIVEFQRLYKSRFGNEITRDKAYEHGMKLLCLVKNIYKPMTNKQYNEIRDQGEEKLKTIYANKDALRDFLNTVL